MPERYRTNREFLFPEQGPSLPEPGVEVVVLKWDGLGALCKTVESFPDPGNGEGEIEYNQAVFWAFRGDLDPVGEQ